MTAELLILAIMALPIQSGECSYYDRASCRSEGTGGAEIRTASGEVLDDQAYTGASWFYKFGTVLRVYCWQTGRTVYIRINDRGPSRRLVRRGRILDVSLRAAERLKVKRLGVVTVWIWRVR